MPALIDAIAAQNLRAALGHLIATCLADPGASPASVGPRCTLVCALWAGVIASESDPLATAESIATCMLRDAHSIAGLS